MRRRQTRQHQCGVLSWEHHRRLLSAMNQSLSCKHQHTRVIAKDSEAEYIECLDCGAVLETSELTESPAPETSSFDESLSDA